MEYLKFHYKQSIFLTAAFILMTVVGTLTHELGHYSMARLLGYEARINYQSSYQWHDAKDKYLNETYEQYSEEIENDLDFPEKEKYSKIVEEYQSDNFWILLSGPLQTILTGTIGLLLLVFYRKKLIHSDQVRFLGWLLIFIALFWLRQVANLFMGIMGFVKNGQLSQYGDEVRLAMHLDINIWTIQLITGIIGMGVLLYVLKILPQKLIMTFLISGLLGGVLGYYLWLIKYGQFVVP